MLQANKVNRSVFLRADERTAAAVSAYREREKLKSKSEAVRRLVQKALAAEGLL
jgi:hypothetical protein